MSKVILKRTLVADLHQRIAAHCDAVVTRFCPLAPAQLRWQPMHKGRTEWSILECVQHLNLTHDYYMAKVADCLATAPRAQAGDDQYAASCWGGIYMHFALNPHSTWPSPPLLTPTGQVGSEVFSVYLAHQERLLALLDEIGTVDLRRTLVPLETFVHFNLGDCLKILVYHDALHIRQAQQVYQAQRHASQPAALYG